MSVLKNCHNCFSKFKDTLILPPLHHQSWFEKLHLPHDPTLFQTTIREKADNLNINYRSLNFSTFPRPPNRLECFQKARRRAHTHTVIYAGPFVLFLLLAQTEEPRLRISPPAFLCHIGRGLKYQFCASPYIGGAMRFCSNDLFRDLLRKLPLHGLLGGRTGRSK